MPGRGALILSAQSGGGYSLSARTEKGARGSGAEEGDLLVAVGVLGSGGIVSVAPGQADPPVRSRAYLFRATTCCVDLYASGSRN